MADQTRPRRDALGNFCFYLHLAILAFIVLGWAWRSRGPLLFYLCFLPAVIVHWKLNANACILNNLESWLRYRRWRAPERNPEEGAWLRTVIRNATGIALTRGWMDVIIYSAMAIFWILAWHNFLVLPWVHFMRFQGP